MLKNDTTIIQSPIGGGWQKSQIKFQKSLTAQERNDLILAGGDIPNELTPEIVIAYMVCENDWVFYGDGSYGNQQAIKVFMKSVAEFYEKLEADRIKQERIDAYWKEVKAKRALTPKKKKRKTSRSYYPKTNLNNQSFWKNV